MFTVEEICEEQERQYNQLMQEDDQYCHPESFKWGFEHGVGYALNKFKNSSKCVECVWHSINELPMFDRGENGDRTPFIIDSYYGHIGGVAHSYTRVTWKNHIDTHRNREFMWAYESDLFPINCKKRLRKED